MPKTKKVMWRGRKVNMVRIGRKTYAVARAPDGGYYVRKTTRGQRRKKSGLFI